MGAGNGPFDTICGRPWPMGPRMWPALLQFRRAGWFSTGPEPPISLQNPDLSAQCGPGRPAVSGTLVPPVAVGLEGALTHLLLWSHEALSWARPPGRLHRARLPVPVGAPSTFLRQKVLTDGLYIIDVTRIKIIFEDSVWLKYRRQEMPIIRYKVWTAAHDVSRFEQLCEASAGRLPPRMSGNPTMRRVSVACYLCSRLYGTPHGPPGSLGPHSWGPRALHQAGSGHQILELGPGASS